MFADTAVILDLETTGLDPEQGNRVTEVAALRISNGRIVERFESLVDCNMRIPDYISKFTGITQRMVDAAPKPLQVFTELSRFIGNDTVIAHNAWFDEAFLQHELRRLSLAPSRVEFLCSLQIARCVLPASQSYAIGSLAARLHIPFTPGTHRAMVDATVTANIVLQLCEVICERFALEHVDLGTLKRLAGIHAQRDVAAAQFAA